MDEENFVWIIPSSTLQVTNTWRKDVFRLLDRPAVPSCAIDLRAVGSVSDAIAKFTESSAGTFLIPLVHVIPVPPLSAHISSSK
ncbi:hypothetical protein QQF64_031738 [Cirrhinus molitorella]|uniref:Uncharacterized protein n=1 Tax=Cirrhinus molitorella TaxID=172907 RepID=A0ABR3MXU0_9TELE